MKVEDLMNYLDMSSRIADEILVSQPEYSQAAEVRQLLTDSQERVRAALSSAAGALEKASGIFEDYNLAAQDQASADAGIVKAKRRLLAALGA
jgi:hypothetical protein